MNCANCDRPLGKLEQGVKWKGHIVCNECHQRLSVEQPKSKSFRLTSGGGKKTTGGNGCLGCVVIFTIIIVGGVMALQNMPVTPQQQAQKAQQAVDEQRDQEVQTANKAREDKQQKDSEAKQNALGTEATQSLLKSGLVTEVDYNNRRVRVQLLPWLGLDAKQKENLTMAFAYHMRSRVGYPEVTVTSNQNDQEMASYGPIAGMKISR